MIRVMRVPNANTSTLRRCPRLEACVRVCMKCNNILEYRSMLPETSASTINGRGLVLRSRHSSRNHSPSCLNACLMLRRQSSRSPRAATCNRRVRRSPTCQENRVKSLRAASSSAGRMTSKRLVFKTSSVENVSDRSSNSCGGPSGLDSLLEPGSRTSAGRAGFFLGCGSFIWFSNSSGMPPIPNSRQNFTNATSNF